MRARGGAHLAGLPEDGRALPAARGSAGYVAVECERAVPLMARIDSKTRWNSTAIEQPRRAGALHSPLANPGSGPKAEQVCLAQWRRNLAAFDKPRKF